MNDIQHFILKEEGRFPNNPNLPVLIYRNILQLPVFFPGYRVQCIFEKNNWKNAWKSGIFTYHHYHSNTHEVLGIIKGATRLQFGGEHGVIISVHKGDVVVIPAGVAHKNLQSEHDVRCVGAYPGGIKYDINTGKRGERPLTNINIEQVPIPLLDPVMGTHGPLHKFWK
jgi:uncharacterized protein YjlB